MSGSGSLTLRIVNIFSVNLTGANSYTGPTRLLDGVMFVSGRDGTIASSSSYDLTGTLSLSNASANNSNRISDTAAIVSHGAVINLTGNGAAATSETAGALYLENGSSTVSAFANASHPTSLNFASISRQNNSTLFVRGRNLGDSPGSGVGQITSATSPGALIGGDGPSGSTTISILPWVIGNLSVPASLLGSSFVTYDSGTGFRPLATGEYASTFGDPTANVRLTETTGVPVGASVNALLFAPSSGATLAGGSIDIGSGAFLYSPTASATGLVSADLNFGTAEGIISASHPLNLSGILSGSGGLTVNAFGQQVVSLTGANTYTGPTTLLAGTTEFSGTIANDGATAGAFGMGTSAIVMNTGLRDNRLYATAESVINRDVIVRGSDPDIETSTVLGTRGDFALTMNGNIQLEGRLNLQGGSSLATAMVINGQITGSGALGDSSFPRSFQVLNGANTFSGGTFMGGTYVAGHDQAFGVGVIIFSGSASLQGNGSATRTIGNEVVLQTIPTSISTFQGDALLNLTGRIDLFGPHTVNVTNTQPTIFSNVVMNGALTKTGTGTLSLNNPSGNTYTGGTILGPGAGTLNVNNSTGSGTGAGTVFIRAESMLSGSFVLSGATRIEGILAPGSSVGTATFGSTLTLDNTADIVMELASAGTFDHLNVGGLLILDGTFVVMTIGGYIAQVGDTFDLLDWGTLDASGFDPETDIDLDSANIAPNAFWDVSEFLVNGTIEAVPEASTVALLVSGFATLLAVRRKRRGR